METFMLTLVRHGETTENKLKIVQGHQDTKLDEVGLIQAGLVGERLKEELFTHVFSSDLSRAYQTCEVIMNCNRVNSVPIISDSRLRERKLGELEGKPQKNCYDFLKSNSRSPGVGMETKTEVRERAKSFFRELCRTIRKQEPNRQQNSDYFNKTSTNCTLHAPCRHPDCKFCSSSSSSPSTTSVLGSEDCPSRELILCNLRGITDNNGTSNHLKDDAAVILETSAATKLENSMDKMKLSLESSSDEEHLGITSEMLQLGGSNTDRPTAFHRPAAAQQLSGISEGYSDDDDPNDRMVPANNDGSKHLANVLVVSHGGFLVELINYFFKELKCEQVLDDSPSLQLQCESSSAAAPSSSNANRNSIMSNAGLSKFSVSLKDTGKPKKISCLFLNDRKHLLDADNLTHPACNVPEDLPC